jgi:hypothetical protein
MINKLQNQPLTAAVEAYNDLFRYYGGGIATSEDCTTEVNHAVTIVGYSPPKTYTEMKTEIEHSCRRQLSSDTRRASGCRRSNEIFMDNKCCREIPRTRVHSVEEPAYWLIMN